MYWGEKETKKCERESEEEQMINKMSTFFNNYLKKETRRGKNKNTCDGKMVY